MSTTAIVSIPEGFDETDVQDIDMLSKQNPERCMMLIDEVMKNHALEIRRRWIAKAEILYFVQERELWKYHPAGFQSIYSWAAQPEIGIAAGNVSEMLALVRFAPSIQEHCDTDVYKLIEEVGISHVRMLIPAIRKAEHNGTMREELTPLLDAVQGSSFREVLKMVSPGGQRTGWDPAVYYEEDADGFYTMSFRGLTFDQMELLATKADVRRWYDISGHRIDPPINALSDGLPLELGPGDLDGRTSDV